jgi:hypothetical protein
MAVLRASAACTGLFLAGFHAWLLAQQAWAGQLQYATSLRWVLAFGVVGGLVALRREGASLRGRRATALWVLAAVLHAPALSDGSLPAQLAETSDVAIQMAGAVLGVAMAFSLARLAHARHSEPPLSPLAAALPAIAIRRVSVGHAFLPRPPPVA